MLLVLKFGMFVLVVCCNCFEIEWDKDNKIQLSKKSDDIMFFKW